MRRVPITKPFGTGLAVKAARFPLCHPASMAVRASAAASFQGCYQPLAQQIKIVGMGSCGVDYLASVASFPRPDEKLRTEKLETQGGGNCANALTAAARLGLSPSLVTKIGSDGLGDGIISELLRDGIDTTHVLRAEGHPSPFTYIIVDRQGGTRTCIHTPGAPLEPYEMDEQRLTAVLEGAMLVYFDGRLTEAAVLLARAARARGIPVLVEAERLRPSLEALLSEADFVVTSAHFPQDWTGEVGLADAILATAERLPAARWVITTLGSRGAVLLERPPTRNREGGDPRVSQEEPRAATLDEVMVGELGPQLEEAVKKRKAEREERPVCVSASGVGIGAGAVVATEDFDAVVDTTGAGDSFIGSVLYGLCTGLPLPSTLRLAAVVAACKCTALGARPGLPTRSQLVPELLHPESTSIPVMA
ncbi:hypothetical protein VOLCADRAFT_84359 [Volvox carteri f. nagariensis]|uniref:Carbohydrate kinase PfkB domain-containing protein n=1 Tax=Volvox carteri f. nagariensis TaxID=3068 RepID=D8UHL3_VOLCA|nr:uncharacterized protein VOLCADRAFT_84359 [Volvox carteri f. nagariensis]EFJ40764.1 hypothetical protein VOLCADRAFT_84359 [Volvox carteri f. nagariensis]|eukprot:XP_002958139.1 hypothetical protein VOLCADRAFT_84359 [Volvox carteri f. nagariensis]